MDCRHSRLTSLQISSLKSPGTYCDGGGVYLTITSDLSAHWVFSLAGADPATAVKIGAVADVSATTARRLANDMRIAITSGQDPRAVVPAPDELGPLVTFGVFARSYITSAAADWKSAHHEQEWRNTLANDAGRLLPLPIAKVDADEVHAVLKPIWVQKPQKARRLLRKIEAILNAAEARGLRPVSDKLAAWRQILAEGLPVPAGLSRTSHASLPWQEFNHFMSELRTR